MCVINTQAEPWRAGGPGIKCPWHGRNWARRLMGPSFSPPPLLAFLCIFLLLSTFLFLSAVFSESWLPLQRIWEAALRDARNSARQACCYIPTGHPQVSMLPTLPGAVYIKERGADVTNPRNRLTCSRKEQGWRNLGGNSIQWISICRGDFKNTFWAGCWIHRPQILATGERLKQEVHAFKARQAYRPVWTTSWGSLSKSSIRRG